MSRYPLQGIGRACEYFTVMRHPIDRLVSAFFYCPKDHDVQDRPPKVCTQLTVVLDLHRMGLQCFVLRYSVLVLVLCCVVTGIVLDSAVLWYVLLCRAVLYQHCIVLCCIPLFCVLFCSIVLCCAVLVMSKNRKHKPGRDKLLPGPERILFCVVAYQVLHCIVLLCCIALSVSVAHSWSPKYL